MRCPKCGFDNPADTLFCEECDWRLDQRYKGEKKRNPMQFSTIEIILGAVALVCALGVSAVGGIAVGVIGMVLGGYSVNLPRYIECNKSLCTALAAIGIILSIMGFLLGLVKM